MNSSFKIWISKKEVLWWLLLAISLIAEVLLCLLLVENYKTTKIKEYEYKYESTEKNWEICATKHTPNLWVTYSKQCNETADSKCGLDMFGSKSEACLDIERKSCIKDQAPECLYVYEELQADMELEYKKVKISKAISWAVRYIATKNIFPLWGFILLIPVITVCTNKILSEKRRNKIFSDFEINELLMASDSVGITPQSTFQVKKDIAVKKWVEVSRDVAEKHPSFGIKGAAEFLRAASVVIPGFGLVNGIFGLSDIMKARGELIPIDYILAAPCIIFFLWSGKNAILLGKHSQYFIKSFLCFLVSGPFISLGALTVWLNFSGYHHGDPKQLQIDVMSIILAWVAWSAIWLPYIIYSKRINVTLRNRVKANDDFLNNL